MGTLGAPALGGPLGAPSASRPLGVGRESRALEASEAPELPAAPCSRAPVLPRSGPRSLHPCAAHVRGLPRSTLS